MEFVCKYIICGILLQLIFMNLTLALEEASVDGSGSPSPVRPDNVVVGIGTRSKLVAARHGLFLVNAQDNVISKSLITYGEWSEKEVELFRAVIGTNDTAIDVGANIGAFSIPLAKIVGPFGKVFCFEPQRHLSQVVAANLALNELLNARVFHEAVGEKEGTIPVPKLNYDFYGNYGSLTLNEDRDWSRIKHENVKLVTLDSYISQLTSCPRLIKIDVEGMELGVLKGAKSLLEQCLAYTVIHLENNCVRDSRPLLEYLAVDLGYDKLYWDVHSVYDSDNYFGVEEDVLSGPNSFMVSMNVLAVKSGPIPPGMNKAVNEKLMEWIENKGMVQIDTKRSCYTSDYVLPVANDMMIVTQLGDLEQCERA